MAFAVRVVLDSISPGGKRLTTLTATYPRFIHAEVMTHRSLARNAASSRAIPWAKMREAIVNDPVSPIHWGAEQKGMQSGGEVEERFKVEADLTWMRARGAALFAADNLHRIGVHKSLVNRLVEPWMWITTLITATEWKNFYRLRVHPDAERHFQRIAGMMQEAMAASTPQKLAVGQWHMPFIREEDCHVEPDLGELETWTEVLKRVSSGRCARISYLTHEGKRSLRDDLALFSKLIERDDDVIHASPLEHVACAAEPTHRSGPFIGWHQFRKDFPGENVEG